MRMGSPQILFITATRIGDAVLGSGLLAHLVQTRPDAQFTIACGPAARPLFEAVPRLRQIIEIRKQRRAGGHWLALWRQTVKTSWDTIVDLRSSGVSFLLRAKRRHILSPFKTDEHRVERMSKVLTKVPLAPKIWTGPEHQTRAAELLPEPNRALALGPTANWHGKQWPIERFVTLAFGLTAPGAALAGAPILVLGGPGEEKIAAPLLTALAEHRVINLVGTTHLLTASACLARSRLFVGNDSGLMHLAAASGCPTLGLFGPSREEHYAPWGALTATARGEPFEAIVNETFDRFAPRSYMTALTEERVHQAALALFNRSGELSPSLGTMISPLEAAETHE